MAEGGLDVLHRSLPMSAVVLIGTLKSPIRRIQQTKVLLTRNGRYASGRAGDAHAWNERCASVRDRARDECSLRGLRHICQRL